MTFFREIGTAVLLLILTLWLQVLGSRCSYSGSVAGDLHKLGMSRSATLLVQFTAAVIVLHGVLILLWAVCYRLIKNFSHEDVSGGRTHHTGVFRSSMLEKGRPFRRARKRISAPV